MLQSQSLPPAHALNLPRLFPPPPFTPSHPVFMSLSANATAFSNSLRSDAESRISEFIQQQTEQVEAAEHDLKRHVVTLWKRFRESLDQIERERSADTSSESDGTLTKDTPKTPGSRSGSSLAVGSPIVREFNPMPTLRVRSPPTPSYCSSSALSASLATSGFYHPLAMEDSEQSRPISSPSSGQTLQSAAAAALLSPPPLSGNECVTDVGWVRC